MNDQYQVVSNENYAQFIASVQNLIHNGFTPIGGVSIAINSNNNVLVFAQALIKKGEN